MTNLTLTTRAVILVGAMLASVAPVAAGDISDWMAENARPLNTVEISDDVADLAPLGEIVGEARVIGFGEGAHDVHELWSLRNRLFAYLVEEMGVTAIAAETGLIQSYATDAYVLGEPVDRLKAARGVFSWSGSVFAENIELVEWMRAYNARPETKRKVRFYGLEMTGCMEADGRPLVDGALAYINGVDPARGKAMAALFSGMLEKFNRGNARELTGDQWNALVVASQDLVSLFERRQVVWAGKTGMEAFLRAYRQAVAVRQLTAHFRMYGEGRDIAAAENLRWAVEREGADGRVFVFAHNSHIAKWRIPPENDDDLHSTMGEFMADYLGNDYIAVGTLYNEGEARDLLGIFRPVNDIYEVKPSKPGSLNGVAAAAGLPLYVLDLARAAQTPAVAGWFASLREIRNLNVRAGYHKVDALAAFDAFIHVDDLTPLHLVDAPEPATNAGACYAD